MKTRDRKIAGLILAAGQGLRMGKAKQLLPLYGVPMLQHVIQNALQSRLDEVVVVLGHHIDKIRHSVDLSAVTVVENPDYRKGQSSSIRAGLKALPAGTDAVLFLLADQPLIDPGIIDTLIEAYRTRPDSILLPSYGNKTGNPALMDRSTFAALMTLDGDIGGRGVFRQFSDRIREIPVQHAGIHLDLDTWQEYQDFLGKSADYITGRPLLEVLQPAPGSVISLTGAGGKTTTLFTLAREMRNRGFRVLATTTTAMYHPQRDAWPFDQLWLEADTAELYPPDSESGSITVAADHYAEKSGKLRGYPPEVIDRIKQRERFDYILVEADGSKGRPLKAPADHEPVLPGSTRYLLGMIGLSVLGKPLTEQWVHRSRLFSELTGLPAGEPVSLPGIQSLLYAPHGLFKSCPDSAERILVLNSADNGMLLREAYAIARTVTSANAQQQPASRVFICRMKGLHPVLAVFPAPD